MKLSKYEGELIKLALYLEVITSPSEAHHALELCIDLCRSIITEMREDSNELRRYVEAAGFTWQEDCSAVFNATTAMGWMNGSLDRCKEELQKIGRWCNDDPCPTLPKNK